MSPGGRTGAVAVAQEFPLLASAAERHLAWAFDFTVAGDLASAMDALHDAHAAAAELEGSAPMGPAPPGGTR